MTLIPDKAGVLESDAHRRVLAHLSTPGSDYGWTVEALATVAKRCKELGLAFCFETGQETPVTLLRTMNDIGTGNLGVNLDPANLLMYGKANPTDALDILGRHVKGVHAKDGEYHSVLLRNTA